MWKILFQLHTANFLLEYSTKFMLKKRFALKIMIRKLIRSDYTQEMAATLILTFRMNTKHIET